MAQNAPPDWDLTMQRRLADGEAAALGESYDRFAPLVHGLAHRVLTDERAADRITSEVFARLWEHPEAYDPARGPLRSWLAEFTHRLAVQRLRSTRTAALARCDGHIGSTEELERTVHSASVAARADYLRTAMPAPLRAALELAYSTRRDCRQAAADLGISEAETHHRLRFGLRLLATAHGADPLDPPLGYGTPPSARDAPPGHGRPK
jgi:RNA polymerase sigma-70 factor (ECF subfamily)